MTGKLTMLHGAGCSCQRCRGFRAGNTISTSHGARSETRVNRAATIAKRRLLRQIGLRQSDLDGIGQALLDNWARAQAKVALMDDWANEHGFLDETGNPPGFAAFYLSALNSARLSLGKLAEHMKARRLVDPAMLGVLQGRAERLR